MTLDVVGTHTDLLGECPIWDPRIASLYTIDIDGRCVRRLDPATGRAEHRIVDGRPGAIALTDDASTILVAVESGLWWLEWDSEALTPWLDVDVGGASHRLNDGALDRTGRLWIGSMHEDATESTGLLYRIEPDGGVRLRQTGVGVPNGLAFSPDGSTMYYADSLAKTVWAYDYDGDTGARARARVLTDFSDLPGTADGATVDEDGCYWIACVFGSAVARLTPSGRVDRIVEVPVDKPTKPAFGGPNSSILFVTSIGGGASHPRYDDPGLNGRLLAIDVGVSGVAEPRIALPHEVSA